MKSVSRTLVKSQPELWELIDQQARMQGLMSALLGHAAEVKVSEREPESILRWEAAGAAEAAWIRVVLAEKGWGTHVEVTAENPSEPVRLDGWLDAVLDELATPEKRPFSGMRPDGEAPPAEPEPVEEPPSEPEPVPAPPEAPPAPPAAKKKRKKRFGFLGF
jgi:hypothetical protein